jgi:TonB-dependent receptor
MTNPFVSPGPAVVAAFSFLFGSAPSALAAATATRKTYDLPSGDAVDTLRRFAEESDKQIVYLLDTVRGVATTAIRGEFTARDALQAMLADTGLAVVEDTKTGALMVNPLVPAPAPPEQSSTNGKRKSRLAILGGGLALALATPTGGNAASDGASLTGSVSNSATGNHLAGARVELPDLGRTVLTDNSGRFTLSDLPAGNHAVVASYLGLDAARTEVTVAAGQRAVRNFDLTTAIYQLAEFKVTGEREGDAAALTAQRNAANVKNVVAMDSFGNLPNMSAGELAMRLPGSAGELDDEGNVTGVTIRGMAHNLNRVTVDGSLISFPGTMARRLNMQNFTAAMFEGLEVVKGHTPDKGADSLGGTINLKSRSTLGMKEKRRMTYNFSARLAPSFTQHVPLREAHRVHPLLNFAYQEVFDVLGRERNLGVAVNLFYSENANGLFRTTRDFQDTPNQPAFVWDYRTQDVYNSRHNSSVSVKFDFQLSPTAKFSLNTIYNLTDEPYLHRYETRAFTNQVVGATGTAGILPGYTDRVTQVRAVAASNIDVSDTMLGTKNRNRHLQFTGEHTLGRAELDYTAQYSVTNINRTANGGGTLTNRINAVGWILDRSQNDLYPRFTPAGGADFTVPANYRPTGTAVLNDRNIHADTGVRELRANLRYELPTRFPFALKTGAQWREEVAEEIGGQRRWNYRGTTALPHDPAILTFDRVMTGRAIPQWGADDSISDQKLVSPDLWTEDRYFYEQSLYTGTRAVTETVTAGYVMGQGRIGRTGWLAGVRRERTEAESWGWVRSRTPSTAAQQQADPVGAARRDYANNFRTREGSYMKSFPSAHLSHDVTKNLKARLSWSTSFGRAPQSSLLANETVNESAQTVTVNNPGLLPQMAENWDASLEYYFEPVGNFSVGWFHKSIDDYIVSGFIGPTIGTGADNGYGGEYAGFTTLTTANAGTAVVQGWEFSYQQQFTFLPGPLKGLSGLINYTVLDTHGNFGGTVNLTGSQVVGFVPRTGNASLAWRYRGFGARVLVNYTGDYITAYSATSAARNLYRFKRTSVNLGLSYQLRPSVSLSCDVANLFNEPQVFYRGIKDQMQSTIISGVAVTVGVSGRF